MITIDNEDITLFLDKLKSAEIHRQNKDDIVNMSKQAYTSIGNYNSVMRAKSNPLWDKSQKPGKCKIYTKGEIRIMEIIDNLSGNEQCFYLLIADQKQPIAFPQVVEAFIEEYPGVLKPTSMQSFVNMANKLAHVGLIKKLSKKGKHYVPHIHRSYLYLQAVPPHEVNHSGATKPVGKESSQPSKQLVAENETADSASPEAVESQNQLSNNHVYDFINEWMEKNNIVEFSVSIKKGDK